MKKQLNPYNRFFWYRKNETVHIRSGKMCLILGALLLYSTGWSQEIRPQKTRCATHESMQEFQMRHPNAETDQQFESWLNSKIQERISSGRTESIVYTIPVIFHIVHNGENPGSGSNISAGKIASQLEQLNKDFANQSGSTYPVAANIEIQFCPALVAPDGSALAEPGIHRINRNDNGWDAPPYSIASTILNVQIFNPYNYVDQTIMPSSIWDPRKYFNIWSIDLEIEDPYAKSTFPISSGLNGLFTYFPENDTHAGVYLNYRCIGSINNPGVYTTFAGLGRTLSHETGHYLGLRHIWGDGSCSNDYCNDTPVQADETSGCPFPGHPQYYQNCPNPGNGTQRMFENYMDYSDDVCMNTFTADQKIRMQTVMANSPRRVELATSNVCCPSADLIVLYPDANPVSVVAGNQTTLYFAEKNQGHSSAGANFVNIHLSADDILTPGLNGDLYLGQYQVNQVLQPQEQTVLLSLPITIPAFTAGGEYYIFFAADGSGVVNECTENNNFATTIITVSETQTTTLSAYRYWFDTKFINAVYVNTGAASSQTILQRNIPTTILQPGLHSFLIQFKDTSNRWSSTSSTFFYKNSALFPAGSARFEYWTDADFENRNITVLNNTSSLVILNEIGDTETGNGLHTVNFRFKPDGKHWSTIVTNFFYKLPDVASGAAQYEFWFDSDYQGKTSVNNSNTTNLILMNAVSAGSLTEGLHSFHIRFRPDGKTWSTSLTSFFYKTKTLVSGTAEYEYWFDDLFGNKTTITTGSSSNFILLDNINTAGVNNGLHTLQFRFRPDGKEWSTVSSSFFYKNSSSIIPVNNLAKFIYWYDNNWQSPKTIAIIGVQNLNWTLNTDVTELSEGRHNLSMSFRDDYGKWSSIVSDSFTRAPVTTPVCQSGNRQFMSGVLTGPGTTFQWQADTGSGFANISDNIVYSGTNSDSLRLTNAPASWYGFKYRCIVTNGSNSMTGEIFILKFINTWTGSVDNTWENYANWSCNSVPDANTDVYIKSGTPVYPVINSNAACRKLYLQPGTSIEVLTGKSLDITGKDL